MILKKLKQIGAATLERLLISYKAFYFSAKGKVSLHRTKYQTAGICLLMRIESIESGELHLKEPVINAKRDIA
jgi:hypothetical protein